MDETVLIGEYEKFLKELKSQHIDLESLNNKKSFLDLFNSLQESLDRLQNMRDNMELKGFKSPYRALSKYGSSFSGEVLFEEMGEVSRHSQFFRTKATAKKNLLDRVKSAISSHRIAIGNLNEHALFKSESLNKTFEPLELPLDLPDDLEITFINPVSARIKIIPYLPLSGDYLFLMNELSPVGRNSFKKIVNKLKTERKGVVTTVSLVIRLMENGRWIRKRVNIETDYDGNYESELKEKYGNNVRIEFLQFRKVKPNIINDKHTRTSLAIAYTRYSEKLIKSLSESFISPKLNDRNSLDKYNEVILDVLYTNPKSIEDSSDLRIWREFQIENKLKSIGLMDENGELISTLNEDIKTKEDIEKNIFSNIASNILMWDLITYYLTTHPDKRSQKSGHFPYLRPELDRNQIQVFDDLDKDTTEFLRESNNEKILYIENVQNLIIQKFDFENKLRGLHMRINYPAFGAAIINKNTDIDIETCADTFFVSKKDIETEIKNLQTIKNPTNTKTKKFLEMIKK